MSSRTDSPATGNSPVAASDQSSTGDKGSSTGWLGALVGGGIGLLITMFTGMSGGLGLLLPLLIGGAGYFAGPTVAKAFGGDDKGGEGSVLPSITVGSKVINAPPKTNGERIADGIRSGANTIVDGTVGTLQGNPTSDFVNPAPIGDNRKGLAIAGTVTAAGTWQVASHYGNKAFSWKLPTTFDMIGRGADKLIIPSEARSAASVLTGASVLEVEAAIATQVSTVVKSTTYGTTVSTNLAAALKEFSALPQGTKEFDLYQRFMRGDKAVVNLVKDMANNATNAGKDAGFIGKELIAAAETLKPAGLAAKGAEALKGGTESTRAGLGLVSAEKLAEAEKLVAGAAKTEIAAAQVALKTGAAAGVDAKLVESLKILESLKPAAEGAQTLRAVASTTKVLGNIGNVAIVGLGAIQSYDDIKRRDGHALAQHVGGVGGTLAGGRVGTWAGVQAGTKIGQFIPGPAGKVAGVVTGVGIAGASMYLGDKAGSTVTDAVLGNAADYMLKPNPTPPVPIPNPQTIMNQNANKSSGFKISFDDLATETARANQSLPNLKANANRRQ